METNSKGAHVSLNSIGSLFSDSFKLYHDRFVNLSEIVLLPALVIVLGYAFIFVGFPFSILGILMILAGWIIFAFSSLALVFSVHNNTGVDASYRETVKFFWPLVWIGILSFFALIGGSIMLIIPGIWLAIAIALRTYTLVIENRRGLDALRQSKNYIKGYWWAVFGRTILVVIGFAVLSFIIHLPFGWIGGRTMQNVAAAVTAFFVIPFATVFYYKIYENLRSLKPELHGAQHKGGGFIKVCAIVGLVVAILLAATVVYAIHENPDGMYMNDMGNMNMQDNWHYQPSNQ